MEKKEKSISEELKIEKGVIQLEVAENLGINPKAYTKGITEENQSKYTCRADLLPDKEDCANKGRSESKTKQKGVFNGTTGQRIKAHREKLGMTQQGLADKLHINRTALSLIENDRRPATLEQLKIFSKEFNVSINYLSCQTVSQASNAEYIDKSSLIEEERLSSVNDLFKKQAMLYADEYLSKLSPERQEDLAIHIYKLLSPKGK